MVFYVQGWEAENPQAWELEPLEMKLLSDTNCDGLHVLKAFNVQPDGTILDCYMDVNLPERISDYAFFIHGDSLRFGYHHEFPGQIVPAVAIDCFGLYEQFYCRWAPEIGISVLKRGLAVAKRKRYIAQDLGYIFRDEWRFQEAAQMFKLAVDEGPSSYFIYGELAEAYAKLGDIENEKRYFAMFKRAEKREG
jgi:tetratricopeptide (TPR) repeat protein